MRHPRIKGQGQSFYHCVSRVVDGRFLFQTQSPGSVEAEYFVHLMRRLEKACCLQVLTYALMVGLRELLFDRLYESIDEIEILLTSHSFMAPTQILRIANPFLIIGSSI